MAQAGAIAPSQLSSALEDFTNDAHKVQHVPLKTLRRTRSSRALYRNLDSSESTPSFHASIWDADVARSDECHRENDPSSADISPTTPRLPQTEFPPAFSLEHVDELSDLPSQTQRSARSNALPSQTLPSPIFHPTQLEPIVEQRSVASLRSRLSRTRLASSPARNVNVVHPERSHHSLHLSQRHKSPWPLKDSLPAPSYQRRAFSLDDLDCFTVSPLSCISKRTRSSGSTSFDSGWYKAPDANCSPVAEPRRPSHSPPERAPTPPGVPSFGSPDAINYFDQPRARSSSWWRIGRSAQPGLSPPDASVAASALAANLNSSPPPSARPYGFLRSFNILANFNPPTSTSQPRRASLPAGVLRADDGTFVRGRFGGRVSGHGISSRGLDGHPMQRAANAVRERKDNDVNDGWVVPRQRESAQRQDGGMAMHGAVRPSNAVHGNASFSSLMTTWFGWENRDGSLQRPREEETAEQREEPRIVDVAADVDELLRRNTGTRTPPPPPNPQTHNLNNAENAPARPSTDTDGAHTTTTIPESKFWHCWRWFCICCCEMTEKELDGCGWYGADRPWTRESRESVWLRTEREVRRQEEAGVGVQVERGRGMRFRPGGSRG